MELLIIGAVIWFIWVAAKNALAAKEGKRQKEIDELLSRRFQVKIAQIEEEKLKLDCFEVKIKGVIKAAYDNENTRFIATIYDETDAKKPVLSMVEEFQDEDSSAFYFSRAQKLPYADSLIGDWMPVFKVPLLFLQFPRKGNRKITVKFYIVNALEKVLTEAQAQISFYNKERGYLDEIDYREKFEEVLIKTALLVSNSDNEMVSSEADIIKHWVKTRLSAYDELVRDEHKQRLNGYIKEGFKQVKAETISINSVLDEINNIASDGEKYELYELCLKVASADAKAEQEELAILEEISDYLQLDRTKLQAMLEKELPINIYTKSVDNEEALIGITSDMDKQQIKKHLIKEYSKWNARVAHKDEKIRKQANEMIKIIVNLQQKYR